MGFQFNHSTSPLVIFLCWVLLTNLLALGCVFNILLYCATLYIVADSARMDKFKKFLPHFMQPYFTRFIEFY
jgi:hypothetical protein